MIVLDVLCCDCHVPVTGRRQCTGHCESATVGVKLISRVGFRENPVGALQTAAAPPWGILSTGSVVAGHSSTAEFILT